MRNQGYGCAGRRARAFVLGALAFALVVLWGTNSHANPDRRMRTVESEHFVVHYPAGAEEVADRAILLAERAHDRLTVELAHEPTLRTHIVITDGTDSANGFANAVPYPRIQLFATAPGSMSVLGAYDDWLDILVTHEYVHVVHIDTVHGVPRLVNALLGLGVLGKNSAPNIVQPRWIVEGLATMEESRLGAQGRHRSALFEMFLRMAVLEDRFQSVDQVTSGARVFPHGSSVYLYGLHMFHHIGERYGHDKLAELSHIYGSRLLPFGVNRAVRDVLGVDFDQLWKEFRIEAERKYQAQARQIRARGLRQGRRLTITSSQSASGAHVRYPVWSPDGKWIYFFHDGGHRNAGIYRVPADGGRFREGKNIGRQGQTLGMKRVVDIEDSSLGSFVGPSESDMVFHMRGTHDYRYGYNDLYRFRGPDPRGREQLTYGVRAREPDVSPDGREVVFARFDIAQSRLAFLDLDDKEVREVGSPDRIGQVYNPEFSPDGRKVAYSGWREGGYRDIWLYDRETGVHERITAARFMDTAPTFTPDGNWLVFASDRSGVFNVYAYDLGTKEVFQVTNVYGGAFEPAISPDGKTLAYAGYTSSGFDIWSMDFDPDTFLAAPSAVDSMPWVETGKPGLDKRGGRPPTLDSKPYRAWRTLYPRTVFPTALEFESSEFLTGVGITSEFSDVFPYHSFIGGFEYLTDFREPVGSVNYTFSRLFPDFSIGFGRGFRLANGFTRYIYDPPPGSGQVPGEDYEVTGYRERSTQVRTSMGLPVIRHPRHSASFQLVYDWTYYENLDEREDVVDPNAPSSSQPEVGALAGVTLGFSYSNLEATRYGYLSEQGRELSVETIVRDERLGSDYGDVQVRGTYSERIPMPWRGHQVLAFRFSGGASAGGLNRRGAFFRGGLNTDQDVIRRLINRDAIGQSGVLRGYRPGAFSGRYYGVANLEYRVPIVDVDRGVGSLPVFLSRVVAAAFTDWGRAWTEPITFEDLAGSVGGSLIFDFRLGYGEPVALFFQYAHGLDPELGLDYFRAVVARSF